MANRAQGQQGSERGRGTLEGRALGRQGTWKAGHLKRKGTWKAGHLKGRALEKEVGKGGESFWKGGVLLERKDSSWRKSRSFRKQRFKVAGQGCGGGELRSSF